MAQQTVVAQISGTAINVMVVPTGSAAVGQVHFDYNTDLSKNEFTKLAEACKIEIMEFFDRASGGQ